MTDPIIDRLDQIKGRADAVTPGPWGWRRNNDGFVEMTASEFGLVSDEDGEFIAAARTDVEQMEAALRVVLDLHKPEPYAQGPDYCDECEHKWPCTTVTSIEEAL